MLISVITGFIIEIKETTLDIAAFAKRTTTKNSFSSWNSGKYFRALSLLNMKKLEAELSKQIS